MSLLHFPASHFVPHHFFTRRGLRGREGGEGQNVSGSACFCLLHFLFYFFEICTNLAITPHPPPMSTLRRRLNQTSTLIEKIRARRYEARVYSWTSPCILSCPCSLPLPNRTRLSCLLHLQSEVCPWPGRHANAVCACLMSEHAGFFRGYAIALGRGPPSLLHLGATAAIDRRLKKCTRVA